MDDQIIENGREGKIARIHERGLIPLLADCFAWPARYCLAVLSRDNRERLKQLKAALPSHEFRVVRRLVLAECVQGLKFSPIKNKSRFLEGYKHHDAAAILVKDLLSRLNVEVMPLGKDVRHKDAQMESEIPDFIGKLDAYVFAFDVKAKSSTKFFGWINDRAIKGYRVFTQKTRIDCFVVSVLRNAPTDKVAELPKRAIGYFNAAQEPKNKPERKWDGNLVWEFDFEYGLPIGNNE